MLLKRPRGITQKSQPRTLKPKNTRKLIRRYHVLLKTKKTILTKLGWEDDFELGTWKSIYNEGVKDPNEGQFNLDGKNEKQLVRVLGQIDGEIAKNGGLEVYQIASTQGQSNKRGSDSSKKLIEWLKADKITKLGSALEIGCLSPENFISKSGIFNDIIRIDLNSQHQLILKQDFMKRPLPKDESQKFDLVSCSLVINFVDNPKSRGDMLRRITEFLNPNGSLFLVLPLPCVTNSRYFNQDKLLQIMTILGFTQTHSHQSTKLGYWLFKWNETIKKKHIKKEELSKGNNRNNFCIVLE